MDKLCIDLYEIIVEYQKEDRLVDIEFCRRVVEKLSNFYNLQDYIEDVYEDYISSEEDNEKFCFAFIQNNSICCNIKGTYECLEQLIDNPIYQELEDELNLYTYLYFTQIITHEINHLRINKKLDARIVDEETLCFLPYRIILNTHDDEVDTLEYMYQYDFYNNHYFLCPDELLADYNAYMLIGKITDIAKASNRLKFFIFAELRTRELESYEKTLTPTKDYLEKLGYASYWDSISNNFQGLSLNRRLSLGLPITSEERKGIKRFRGIILYKS